ncbi:cutinase family protein [Mycobacterium sp. CVI_P3]|uniref:Cutinase family protein n=1 Tax=Mycobacterium pinniadriaticum TaxID=2994102 RepID=A0ABT3S8I1_9MYCO|nr:cutinase family protein [Mycobacterium pinniadriaticum]MCX2929386.1 cutinase family protein [Mycobacterium pinniadriaticum]MCX2935810.1 cutinase family protein [Mycobacterium pinniadriaticum]
MATSVEEVMVIGRVGSVVLAAGIGLAGLATGTASAAPECADFHWIGAAGSGQRDGAGLTANGGMGSVVYQSYQQLKAQLAAEGRTIDAEAVQYPATAVPLEGSLGGWLGFLGSVGDGTEATADQYEAFTQRCPASKVILAGYSQGAMIVHRNLYDLADDPQLAAALLIADGDRLPVDTTIKLGSTAVTAGRGEGVAQEHSFLASTNTATLPPSIGVRTISVCDVGDPVCDYDPDAKVSDAAIAIHTSYAPAPGGPHAWGAPLYSLVTATKTAPPVELTAHTA